MLAACGETYLRNKTGTIRSPKFINSSDHYYQYHRHQCDWIIRAPPGHVVTLEIEELNWHSAHACYYHNLTIRNKNNPNRNGTTIAVLCAGQLTLSRFLSPTNKLFVSYHYISRSFSLPSFNLKYQVHGEFPTDTSEHQSRVRNRILEHRSHRLHC